MGHGIYGGNWLATPNPKHTEAGRAPRCRPAVPCASGCISSLFCHGPEGTPHDAARVSRRLQHPKRLEGDKEVLRGWFFKTQPRKLRQEAYPTVGHNDRQTDIRLLPASLATSCFGGAQLRGPVQVRRDAQGGAKEIPYSKTYVDCDRLTPSCNGFQVP